MIHLVPGDPVRTMLGFRATPENVAQVRAALGLDQPLLAQYTQWLGGSSTATWVRTSSATRRSATLLAQRLPVTLELTVLSMTLAIAVGVPLGVRAATDARLGPTGDRGFVIAGIAIPDFWLGIMLVLLFAGIMQVLPPSGLRAVPPGPRAEPAVHGPAGAHARVRRGGVHPADHARRHGGDARHAVRPVRQGARALRDARSCSGTRCATPPCRSSRSIGIQFGVLLGGAIVVETLFALPGVGRLVVTAINQRNYTVVQGGVLVVATLFILVTLLTDLVVGWLDPRTRGRARRHERAHRRGPPASAEPGRLARGSAHRGARSGSASSRSSA